MEHEPSLESGPSSPPWNTTLKVVVGVLAVILIGLAAYAFRAVFVPVILGCIIAYVLSPVVRDLTLSLPLPRVVATLLVFLAVIAIVIPVGVLGIQELIREAATFGNRLIAAIQTLSEMGGDTIHILGFEIVIGTLQDQIAAQLTSTIRDMIPSTVNFALSAARTVVFGVFTLFIGFYLTRDADRIVVSIKKLVPPAYRADADALLGEINSVWAAFLRGQAILALIVTVILTGVSAALGLPQPLLLGVWGGLLEFLPSIGNMIWGATAITLAIVEGSSTLSLPTPVFVLVVVIAYVAFAQLDMNVLIPNILGGQIRLHPVVVLIGVIIGLSVGGVLGVALAAPTIASLRVIGRYLYAKIFDLPPFPPDEPPGARAEAQPARKAKTKAKKARARKERPGPEALLD